MNLGAVAMTVLPLVVLAGVLLRLILGARLDGGDGGAGEQDDDGGGNQPRVPPPVPPADPGDGEPDWWPAFEREFAAYAARHAPACAPT